METYQLRFCLKKLLIYVMNNRLGSYNGWKILLGEPTKQFLYDTFTIESNGEKNLADTFSVHCVFAVQYSGWKFETTMDVTTDLHMYTYKQCSQFVGGG